jgi:hypothetical protein
MRLVHALGAAVAATTLVASVAQAALSVSLVQIPVPSGVASSIAGTTAVRTFDLRVTQTATEKFDVGNLQVTLASGGGKSGYFYASPGHSDTTAIDPNVTGNPEPKDPYDTFVTSPAFQQTHSGSTLATNLAVTGSADWPVGPGSQTATVPAKASNNNAGNQSMNIVWGDPQSAFTTNTSGASTYTIAQFTVVGNTGAFIKGYLGTNNGVNTPQFFTPNGTGALASLPAGVIYLPILGDTNRDGSVGLTDLNNVENNFGGSNPAGDTNADGTVGLSDLNAVENNFGNSLAYTPPPGGALGALVPEPSMLSLGVAGLAVLARRGRRAAK